MALSFILGLATTLQVKAQTVNYETPFKKTFTTSNKPDITIPDGSYTTKIYFTYTDKSVEIVEAEFYFNDPYFYKRCKAIEIPLKNIDGATTEISANDNKAFFNIGLKKENVYYQYTSSTEKLSASGTYQIPLGNEGIEAQATILDQLAEKLPAKEKEKYDSGAMARVINISDIKDAQTNAIEIAKKQAEEYSQNAPEEKPSNAIRVFAKNSSKVGRTIYWTSEGHEKKAFVKAGQWVQVDGIIGDTISDESGNVKFTLTESIELYPVVYR